MTPLRRRVSVPVLGALLLAAVVGCSPGEKTEPSPVPTVAISVPIAPPSEEAPTPSSSAPDPSTSPTLDEEQQAASEVVLMYFTLVNDLSKTPDLDLEALSDITTGRTKELDVAMIEDDRRAGITQTGDNRYYIKGVAPVEMSSGAKTTVVDACTDSTGTDLIDEKGDSVLDEDRAFFVRWTIKTIVEDSRWKVGDITNERVTTCGA